MDVTNLPLNLTNTPPKYLLIYQRYIKAVTVSDIGFKLELRDKDWLLSKASIGKITSKFCDHDLGDAFCGVDLTPHTYTQTITSIASRYEFTCDGTFTSDEFSRGKITFNTGNNAGLTRDIATFDYSGNTINLWQSLPHSFAVGDEVNLVAGCRKTLYDCIVRFNNAIKSDSEPHIPSLDLSLNPPIETD